jgi:hypothetical protein
MSTVTSTDLQANNNTKGVQSDYIHPGSTLGYAEDLQLSVPDSVHVKDRTITIRPTIGTNRAGHRCIRPRRVPGGHHHHAQCFRRDTNLQAGSGQRSAKVSIHRLKSWFMLFSKHARLGRLEIGHHLISGSGGLLNVDVSPWIVMINGCASIFSKAESVLYRFPRATPGARGIHRSPLSSDLSCL